MSSPVGAFLDSAAGGFESGQALRQRRQALARQAEEDALAREERLQRMRAVGQRMRLEEEDRVRQGADQMLEDADRTERTGLAVVPGQPAASMVPEERAIDWRAEVGERLRMEPPAEGVGAGRLGMERPAPRTFIETPEERDMGFDRFTRVEQVGPGTAVADELRDVDVAEVGRRLQGQDAAAYRRAGGIPEGLSDAETVRVGRQREEQGNRVFATPRGRGTGDGGRGAYLLRRIAVLTKPNLLGDPEMSHEDALAQAREEWDETHPGPQTPTTPAPRVGGASRNPYR